MHCGCFAKSKVVVDKPRRVLSPLVQHSFQSYFLTLQSLILICKYLRGNEQFLDAACEKKAFRLSPVLTRSSRFQFLGLISNMWQVECGGMNKPHEGQSWHTT